MGLILILICGRPPTGSALLVLPGLGIGTPSDARFALVHIDCDLYKPFKAGLEFFYPRLVTGGFLIMHDYTSLWWDGVERAVESFLQIKKRR